MVSTPFLACDNTSTISRLLMLGMCFSTKCYPGRAFVKTRGNISADLLKTNSQKADHGTCHSNSALQHVLLAESDCLSSQNVRRTACQRIALVQIQVSVSSVRQTAHFTNWEKMQATITACVSVSISPATSFLRKLAS